MAIILGGATDSVLAIDLAYSALPEFLDLFTYHAGEGESLDNHTPDIGYDWHRVGSTADVLIHYSGFHLRYDPGGFPSYGRYYAFPTVAGLGFTTQDYDVTAVMGFTGIPDGTNGQTIRIRARDQINNLIFVHAFLRAKVSGCVWGLEYDCYDPFHHDGTYTLYTATTPMTLTLNRAYVVTLKLRGTSAWLYVDGVLITFFTLDGFYLSGASGADQYPVGIEITNPDYSSGTSADYGWVSSFKVVPYSPQAWPGPATATAAVTDLADAHISTTYLGPATGTAAVTDTANGTVRGPQTFTGPATGAADADDDADAAIVPYTVAYVSALDVLALTQYAPSVRATQFTVQVLRTVVIGVYAGSTDAADADDDADAIQAGSTPAAATAAVTDLADAVRRTTFFAGTAADSAAASELAVGVPTGDAGGGFEFIAVTDLSAGAVFHFGDAATDSVGVTDLALSPEHAYTDAGTSDSADAAVGTQPFVDTAAALDGATAVMRLPARDGALGLAMWSGYDGEFPFCFVECPGGVVLIANGINPVLRWSPISKQIEAAGVIAPKAGVRLTTNVSRLPAVADILPKIYDAGAIPPRWVFESEVTSEEWFDIVGAAEEAGDSGNELDDGQVQWWYAGSLVQGPVVPAGLVEYRTDLVTAVRFRLAGLVSGTGGTRWIGNLTWMRLGDTYSDFASNPFDTYRAYVRFLDRYGNPSDLSPLLASVSGTENGPWGYEDVAVPADPKVVRREIYRSVRGTFQTVYLDVTTADLTSTSFSGTRTDDALVSGLPLAIITDQGDIIANVYGVPPAHKSALCHHLGRVFAAVDVDYTTGCVSLAYGSATVTGIGTRWIAGFAGRVFSPGTLGETYEIKEVDEDAQTLTLLRPYQGQAAPYLAYAIRPSNDQRRTVYYSEAGLPQAWPAWNGISLTEDHDELTGLMSYNSFLYIFERRHIYRFTFQSDPATDGGIFLSTSRGVVNNRCWVIVEGGVYALDEQGVHQFSGSEEAQPLSEDIQDLFRGGGRRAINWQADRRYWHAAHDARSTTIRWFVSMGQDARPRDALTYNYRTKRWWVESYPFPVTASVELEQGLRRSMLGLEAREVAVTGESNLDLFADTSDTAGSVASALPFSLTGVRMSPVFARAVGRPVAIAAGRGAGQVRLVTAAGTDTAWVDRPWTVLPDSTSAYQFGGIPWSWRSGWFDVADSEDATVRDLALAFRPTRARGEVSVSIHLDHSEEPQAWGFAKHDDGLDVDPGDTAIRIATALPRGSMVFRWSAHQEVYSLTNQYLSVVLAGVSIAERIAIYSLSIGGVEGGE